MPAVVSDPSPLVYLAQLGALDFLPRIYGEVFVPHAVWAEAMAAEPAFPSVTAALRAAQAADAFRLRDAVCSRMDFLATLDPGEAAAINLAAEIHADLLLIDELRGRAAAVQLGLRVKGTLGVLLEAKARGLIPLLAPVLERLRRETTSASAPNWSARFCAAQASHESKNSFGLRDRRADERGGAMSMKPGAMRG